MIKQAPANLGVQKTLDKLAEKPEFKAILLEEIDKRRVCMTDVQSCLHNIYHEASKRAHGNTSPIILNEAEFSDREMVVLISFFRLQDKWRNSLQWNAVWKEVEEGGRG